MSGSHQFLTTDESPQFSFALQFSYPHLALINSSDITMYMSNLIQKNICKWFQFIGQNSSFGKGILQVPDTGTSQYSWRLKYLWCANIALNCDIYILYNMHTSEHTPLELRNGLVLSSTLVYQNLGLKSALIPLSYNLILLSSHFLFFLLYFSVSLY